MISKLIPTFGLCLLAVATTASTSVGSLRLADDWNLRQGPVQPTDDDWNLRQGPVQPTDDDWNLRQGPANRA